MMLKKHAWVIWTITLLSVIVLLLVVPFARTVSWWVAAVSTVAMFGVCAYAFFRAFDKADMLISKILGWPVFKVGYAALIMQIAVSALIMGTASVCPVWVAIVAEVVVFGMAGIGLIIKDAAREAITRSEAKVLDATTGWKTIRAKAVSMPEKVRDALRYADPTPTDLDVQISEAIDENDADKVLKLLESRKAIAKNNKH